MSKSSRGTWFIIVTLLLALILTLLPLPNGWGAWRPSWLLLVLSFWVIQLPDRIGLLWAVVFGILLDVLLGTSMGLHSFSLSVTTFIIQLLHKRIRLFPQWKQALTMAFISLIYMVATFWLTQLTGKSLQSVPWPSVLINAALWPWLYLVLRSFIPYFKVS